MRKYLFSAGFALLVAAASVSVTAAVQPAFAAEIKSVVNGIPITTGDIADEVTPIDGARFAADLAADPMATEKLASGIDAFAKDLEALRQTIRERL